MKQPLTPVLSQFPKRKPSRRAWGAASAAAAAVFCSLLFPGCYSYRPPPEVVEGEDYTAKTRIAHRGLPSDDIMLSLEEAIQIALENNPSYAATRHSIAAAYARLYQSFSNFMPTVSGNVSAAQGQVYTPNTASGTNWATTNSSSVGLSGNWNVFNGLQDTMNMLSARYSAKRSESLNRDARRSLIQLVISAFNQIILCREQIRIAESNEMYQQILVDDAQVKYDKGESPLRDLLDFKIQRDNASYSLIGLRMNYNLYRYVLAELMGLTSGTIPEGVKFPEIETVNSMDHSLEVEFYLDMAVSQRPDLQAHREALAASKFSLYATWGSFLPTANLNMSGGRNDTWPVGESHYWGANYGYGMSTNWLIFDGGSRWAQVRQAQANVAISEEQLAGRWIAVVKEVREAHTKLLANIAEAKILVGILDTTRQQRDLVKSAYDAGEEIVIRVNQAQTQLINAQLRYASALVDVENSKAELDASCGIR